MTETSGMGSAGVFAVAGAVAISFSGVFVQIAALPAEQSSFLRTLYAVPVLAVIVLIVKRREHRSLRGTIHFGAVLVGVLEGVEVIAYHASIPSLGVGIATVLSNVQVVFVGIAGVLLFRERPRWWFWGAIPLMLVGVAMINTGSPAGVDRSAVVRGLVIALVGALTYAVYLVALRFLRLKQPQLDTTSIMASVTVGTLIPAAAAALVLGTARPAPTVMGNVWMLALALSTPVLGWWLLTHAIHRIPASFTSVTLLLQPTLALVWGVVLLSQDLTSIQIAGGVVVLIGIGAAQYATVQSRRKSRTSATSEVAK